MKISVTLLILFALSSLNTFAQDYTQFSLPQGAKARLGKGDINEIAYSPDGTHLAVAGSIGIWLYDTTTYQEVALLTGHTGGVLSVSFSPDGRTIASGSGDIWFGDDTVRLWDAVTGEHLRTLEGHTDSVRSVAFSPDGRTLASGGSWQEIRLWDALTGAHIRTLSGHTDSVLSVAFSPAGRTLASASWDGAVLLWELTPATKPLLIEDVNGDGVVNIQDLVLVAGQLGQTGQNDADVNGDGAVNIQDLVLVAGALGQAAAAPSSHPQLLALLTAADVEGWLTEAQALDLIDAQLKRGILFLERLLAALSPKETVLLPNYPNPFNPETWIPYHLADAADVQLIIYDTQGAVVRWFDLGHQIASYYTDRAKAVYWDGRNQFGESVASGLYFYTLTAGDFTGTRRMLILK